MDAADTLPLKVLIERVRRVAATTNKNGDGHRVDVAVAAAEAFVAQREHSATGNTGGGGDGGDDQRGQLQVDEALWEASHHPVLDALQAAGSGIKAHRRELEQLGTQVRAAKRYHVLLQHNQTQQNKTRCDMINFFRWLQASNCILHGL